MFALCFTEHCVSYLLCSAAEELKQFCAIVEDGGNGVTGEGEFF